MNAIKKTFFIILTPYIAYQLIFNILLKLSFGSILPELFRGPLEIITGRWLPNTFLIIETIILILIITIYKKGVIGRRISEISLNNKILYGLTTLFIVYQLIQYLTTHVSNISINTNYFLFKMGFISPVIIFTILIILSSIIKELSPNSNSYKVVLIPTYIFGVGKSIAFILILIFGCAWGGCGQRESFFAGLLIITAIVSIISITIVNRNIISNSSGSKRKVAIGIVIGTIICIYLTLLPIFGMSTF